ncbi:MAG: methionine gamma-lyase family protein [Clostridiales bacterium]|nr:methionine gamma-lyase family protein [Clostridiales bacterium]
MKKIVKNALNQLKSLFDQRDEITLINQQKVLDAFIKNKIALRHFSPSTGYGYGDDARDTLIRLYADVFGTETAIVSPMIASGTHALTIALFGLLRPGQTLLFATGTPYDTLNDVIAGENIGSLKDFGINCVTVPLKNGAPDLIAIENECKRLNPSVVMIQRSRGYEMRPALSVDTIKQIADIARSVGNPFVLVDNCYGEFTEVQEPCFADAIVGSLIKNPGGGICPTGGYICGTEKAIAQIEGRLTSPSIGREVGSYAADYRPFYQGLFLAPHTVAQSIKTAMLFSEVFSSLGYDTMPKTGESYDDIICSIKFGDKEKLIEFCKAVQSVSPVDSFASPEPWDMPGYNDQVIMAAGAFVQGSSIELSCDAPIRQPYIAYLQGGLTFEHGIIALEKCLDALKIR